MTDSRGEEQEKRQRLAEENRDLKTLLHYLSNHQRATDQRLRRLEESVVFRFLRWLGPKLTLIGIAVPGVGARNTDEDYEMWLQQMAALPQIDSSRPPNTFSPPRVAKTHSLVLNARGPDRSRFARTVNTIDIQHDADLEMLVLTDPVPPYWLPEALDRYSKGRTVRIIPSGTTPEGFRRALQEECQGEYAAIVSGDALLEPLAIAAWACAAEPDAAAVYSDWDFVSASGRRHTPRFTPENSPELLSRTTYWGNSYLVRTSAVRELEWPVQNSDLPPEDTLAILLAASGRRIQRVPRILWHLQDGAADPLARKSSESFDAAIQSSQAGTEPTESSQARSAPRVSVVICSRKAKLLDKCLKNLRTTLEPGDEIVVVAHLQEDAGGLEKVANAYGARVVPYRGPFHFGLMNRLGVEAAAAPMICLMNDDVIPVTQDWLSIMLAQASHPDVGIVGALLLYPDGTIEHAGIAVGGRHLPAHIGRHQTESPYWLWLRVTREVTAVTGACMVMRRTVWNDLEGFDIRFPVNFNDVDLCLRAINRGYKNILEARAILNHAGSQTRIPMVHSAEHELLYKLWWQVLKEPDRFFNPQLRNTAEPISLGSVDYP